MCLAHRLLLARAAGFKLTMHCDVNQENTLTHLHQCLETIGVDRIDHGINSLQDPALIEMIRERGLGLTVCPVCRCAWGSCRVRAWARPAVVFAAVEV